MTFFIVDTFADNFLYCAMYFGVSLCLSSSPKFEDTQFTIMKTRIYIHISDEAHDHL